MPTPDQIALPELPDSFGEHCVYDSVRTMREPGYTADQMRAYGQACVDAAHPIPADMVLVPREATEEMARAGAQDVSCLSRFGAKVCYEAMIAAAPPLNEVFGNSEQLPLNEPSGDSGQLASLEQRAREFFRAELLKDDVTAAAARRLDADNETAVEIAAIRAITAALSMAADSSHGIETSAGSAHSGEVPDRIRHLTGSGSHVQGDRTAGDDGLATAAAALSAQPPSETVAEPGAIRALVTAANAVLALYPADDGMWTLEQAVLPFNAAKPGECADGCPKNQVCDYCQFAAPQPREVVNVFPADYVLPCDVLVRPATTIAKGCTLRTLMQSIQLREGADPFTNADYQALSELFNPQPREVQNDTNWHECPHCKGWSRAATPQDAAGVGRKPPEPVSHPSGEWCDRYAEWHEWFTTKAINDTTPPPGVDGGKLRERVQALALQADGAFNIGGEQHLRNTMENLAQGLADTLAAIDAAAPGVGNG